MGEIDLEDSCCGENVYVHVNTVYNRVGDSCSRSNLTLLTPLGESTVTVSSDGPSVILLQSVCTRCIQLSL